MLLGILFAASCQKKDPNTPEPPDPEEPPVQVVPDTESTQAGVTTIPYPANLDSTSFRATLGDVAVHVLNSGDTALIVAIPPDIDTGIVTLKIPALSFEYHIRVKESAPLAGVDEHHAAVSGLIESLAGQLGEFMPEEPPVGYEAIHRFLTQLSPTDKLRLARFFKLIQQASAPESQARLPDPLSNLLKVGSVKGVPYAGVQDGTAQLATETTRYAAACFQLDAYARYALLAPPNSPEKAIVTYIGWLYGQLAGYHFRQVLGSQPIIDRVFLSANQLMELPPPPAATDPASFPIFKAGLEFPFYAAVTFRSIAMVDRPTTDSGSAPRLLPLFFDAYDLAVVGAEYINTAMAAVPEYPFYEDIPALALPLLPETAPDQDYLWAPMSAQWIAEHLTLDDATDRFVMIDKAPNPGMALLTVGYNGNFRAKYREVHGLDIQFERIDDFNAYRQHVPIKIQAPDPERIVISAEDDTPMRFTLPYGRMNLKLNARVYPEAAPQDVFWSITEGHKLATISQDGGVTSTFKTTNDTTGYGYTTVRARAADDESIHTEVEVKTTSYKIKYVAGAGQSFTGGIPYPIMVSVEDRLDGSCLFNPVAPRTDNAEEKLRLAGFAVNARFGDGNDFMYITGDSGPIPQMCALSLYFSVPRRGVDPYDLPLWVYLYQDEHIIDRLAIKVRITDFKP